MRLANTPAPHHLARMFNIEIGVAWGEALATVLLMPLLLLPVIWNRFPIIYYDSGAYIFEGLTLRFIPERAAAYSLFLRFAGAATSLWIIPVIQAAMSAFLLTQIARTVAPRMRWSTLLALGAVLVVATSLPWYTGEIEPDCFTALLVVSFYLIAFRTAMLGLWRSVVVAFIGAIAIAFHPSHFVLSGFLLFLLVAWRILRRRQGPRILVPTLVCITGLFLVVAANFHLTRQIFITRAGAPFVFARMLQDGIVMRLLDETCPKSGYRLCSYKDELPPTADAYLWTPHSPFFALGHFQGTARESARIVRDALVRYPLLQLRAALADTAAQFVRFRTGEGMEPQQWVLRPVFVHLIPQQVPAYLAARQQQGQFDFRMIGRVQAVIGFVSLAGLLASLIWSVVARRACDGSLPLFVLVALLGNAVVCGVLSGPHDRYQSRLMWIAPLAAILSVHSLRRAYTPDVTLHKEPVSVQGGG